MMFMMLILWIIGLMALISRYRPDTPTDDNPPA